MPHNADLPERSERRFLGVDPLSSGPTPNDAGALMRIAYFHYVFGSDSSLHHVKQFVAAARGLGHEVTVHAMNPAPPDEPVPGSLDGNSLRLRRWLKKHLSYYLHEPKELAWNRRYAKREQAILSREAPDVMVVRAHHLTFAEAMVRKKAGIPLVLEVNAPAIETTKYFHEYMHVPYAAVATERMKLRAADRVVVVSEALRDHFVELHGLPAEKFVVNPNGGDCERFRPDLDSREIRERHDLGDDVVVGYVGTLQPFHGPEYLKAMIAAVARPGVRFMLVGVGADRRDVVDWIEERGLGDRVVLTGAVPHADVPRYVAAMDVALIPGSNFYGSPLKLFEYMACGCAVVAVGVGPVAEIVRDGENGLLFPPRDVETAVSQLERLIADPSLRKRLGERARAHVLRGYTWSHNAERVVHACEAAAAIVRRPAA